jgi:sodium transport system permease protein
MSRLARINTIWRKELVDTLRDRRTLIAMILVPMALYPAMILGSLQGFELQLTRLKQEEYRVVVGSVPPEGAEPVNSAAVAHWLRTVVDSDPARRPGAASQPAEALVEKAERGELPAEPPPAPGTHEGSAAEAARADVRRQPPKYVIDPLDDADELVRRVATGQAHVGIVVGDQLPSASGEHSALVTVLMDQTDIRSQIAAAGLQAILDRAGQSLLDQRLKREDLDRSFIEPLQIREQPTATPEKVGGSILGQIVPLILIIMTITGAIYPAIDLTAGERERGTLETLMVAPVPTVDLIAGKFVVVALIGMLSAALNLLSIGGTIYLGGLGSLLTQGGQVVIPLGALPWVLLLLVPLAVMFSALLLAVCSFARSFKEAQNYVMPVMVAALIPAVVGVLPGTRLEGPLLIMPVTNIVILTRDLFTGKFELVNIIWVTASTTLYAGAAVAVAARLFGQEAVLFADSGSIKTLFQRRFFKPRRLPTAAQAFLLIALVFSLNFFAQQGLLKIPGLLGTLGYWVGLAAILATLFVALPAASAAYTRTELRPTFALAPPPPLSIVAALCFGASTWVLAQALLYLQNQWLPMPQEMIRELEKLEVLLQPLNLATVVLFLAIVPAVCEELFFRGYALSGLRGSLGKWAALAVVALAFGVNHHSIFRLAITTGLGLLFGLLVVQFRSIWPAMLAHALHNGLSVLASRADGLKPLLDRLGCTLSDKAPPPLPWVLGALAVATLGIAVCLLAAKREIALESSATNRAY